MLIICIYHLHVLICMQTNKQIFQIYIKCLKTPTERRQTSWLFKKHSQGVELGATKNKSSE